MTIQSRVAATMGSGVAYVLLLFCVAVPAARGQAVVRIHQMIAANSVLDRPETIRELQASMRTSWSSRSEESIASLVDQRLKEVQEKITMQLGAVSVRASRLSNTVTILFESMIPLRLQIVIPFDKTQSFKGNFGNVRTEVRRTFKQLLQTTTSVLIRRPGTPKTIADGLEATLALLLSQTIAGKNETLLDSTAAVMADVFVGRLETMLLTEIRKKDPGFDTDDAKEWERVITSALPENIILEGIIQNVLSHVRTLTENALTQARSTLVSVVHTMEGTIFSGLGGISITRGTGDAGGGIEVTFRSNAHLQGRMFADVAFQPENDQMRPYGMLGLQTAWTPEGTAFQLGALGTLTVRETTGASLGLGGSLLIGDNILLGLSLAGAHLGPRLLLKDFKQSVDRFSIRDFTWSAALSLKGASPGSPIFLLGNVAKKGSLPSVTFQISYPITDQE